IIDSFKKPDKSGKASKLVEKDFEGLKLKGRRIGDQKIVFIETERFDDFEKEVFMDVLDHENVMIFDQHNHPDHRGREIMHNSSVPAEKARKCLEEFLELLEEEELYTYSAGFSTSTEGKALTALVEEVDGQRTLLLGSDENGPCKSVLEAEKKFSNRFDEVNIFTTDTHEDLKDLASKKSIDGERIDQTVEEAVKGLSKARIGFATSRAEKINLLHRDYYGLMHSINILTRLFPLSVIILYISAIIWIL
ncbi:MAG: DUF2070 family protein, partial [Candidatus Nanohalobium sp.]